MIAVSSVACISLLRDSIKSPEHFIPLALMYALTLLPTQRISRAGLRAGRFAFEPDSYTGRKAQVVLVDDEIVPEAMSTIVVEKDFTASNGVLHIIDAVVRIYSDDE